jgi:formate dehydrogenase iron-sulfur subunit
MMDRVGDLPGIAAPRGEIQQSAGAGRGASDRAGYPPAKQEAEVTAGTRITPGRAYGFFTDTTLCIGCKACEVACKQWNNLPASDMRLSGESYDNTRQLSATTWRHVEFIEQFDESRFEGLEEPEIIEAKLPRQSATGLRDNLPADFEPWGNLTTSEQWARPGQRWIFMSDVCKHCRDAPCLEACPTDSIRFGPVDELLRHARERVVELRERGIPAYLYGSNGVLEEECDTTRLDGLNCFFLLIDRPEVYNLPPVPHRPSSETAPGLLSAAIAAGGLVAAAMLAFAGAGGE